jgi:hypothetical protein
MLKFVQKQSTEIGLSDIILMPNGTYYCRQTG